MAARQPRRKYGNKKVIVDGIKFDSKAEARRYCDLRILQRAGQITDLELQPRYDIIINGKKVCYYKADFRYKEKGATVVEDVKSEATAKNSTYRLKNKLVKACHGVDILETK